VVHPAWKMPEGVQLNRGSGRLAYGYMEPLSLERALMAVEDVRERLLRSTQALDRAQVPYAVVGGHAVAVWVARVDASAVRNTVDVDILLRPADLAAATRALGSVGFEPAHIHGVTLFVEQRDPNPRRAIHVVYAGELVRPGEPHPAPDIGSILRAAEGFAVVDLPALLTMKLTAFRDKDRTHLRDMLELGLVRPEIEAQLPADLRNRLAELRATRE
jgi:hypothetical protein